MSLTARQDLPTLAQRQAHARPSAIVTIVASLLARLRDDRARTRHARAIAELDAVQCADVGLDRSAALPPRPILEVERGLMSRLMDMR